MIIERPPRIFRWLVPGAEFRRKGEGERMVYLTFDDGPIPEATPEVLDILDRYGVKATFFMVGDNVRKYPALLEEVKRRGHRVGNHTMHHLQGSGVTTRTYLRDVCEADELIGSDLFRPPHGWLRPRQTLALRSKYRIVMFDLVTRDYSKHVDAPGVVENVKRYSRPGTIIVFHDSLKSIHKLRTALPESIEWLMSRGYEFGIL
ncbi:MAG: polysaccharide deacetylase family protein [Bacteroidales bacterium]|nr:polysaccharide deacetylase family protein [Bacteroidales bacterium]MDE7466112.1 polysaccharide deacetylase family protein [Muribaculaceae bacterium]